MGAAKRLAGLSLFGDHEPWLDPTDIELRPYQYEAISAIRSEFEGLPTRAAVDSTLLVLPTGTGKTLTFGYYARDVIASGGRVLILAHRGELIDQAFDSMVRLGLRPTIEKADQYARAIGDFGLTIATVQTMQRDRLASWPRTSFDLLITDEAHHATADTYRRIYQHFQGPKPLAGARKVKHLGVTATADRADETFLGEIYESVAYELSLWEAMTAEDPGPWLCRLRFVQCDVGIDLRSIRTTGGDLNQADLEEAIRPHVEALANAIRQEVGERKTLVFTPDVGSAQAMATALDSLGLAARWVSGDDPDRRAKVADFKAGQYQLLCNCALLMEGFDCPDIAAIVLCRPTKSRPCYAQMVGRGTRLAPGKTDCLLVDFNWLTEKHDLVRPVELFDTTHTDAEVQEIAGELLKQGSARDLTEVIEQATEEHRRRQTLRIQAREREVRYRKVVYDPITVMEVLGVPKRKEAQSLIGTATAKQVACLSRFKVESPEKMSKRAASLLIGTLIDRAGRGLATQKQVGLLIRHGFDPAEARDMTIGQASHEIDRILGHRNR